MKLLVVGSCTGEKDIRDCPYRLTEADFDDAAVLRRRESELAKWALPAARLYTGWQHRYMMNGIDALRSTLVSLSCSVKIISAGYGLVDERQFIIPYEVTFQGQSSKRIRERAERLGIPKAVRAAIQGYECVMFLLGNEYLLSISLPLSSTPNQRFVFFTSKTRLPFDPSSTVVPAGRAETRFGAGIVALKGKMFEHFAIGLCRRPETWNSVCSDETPSTVLKLIETGQRESWTARTT